MIYALSKIDQLRFGVVTAKATLENSDDVQGLLNKAEENNVEFLIIRLATNNLKMVQALEQQGAFLTDTLVYYVKKKIESYIDCLPDGYSMRLSLPGDADRVGALAIQAFNGYLGHYHADSRLSKEDCDLVYSSWASDSCRSENIANSVILLEKNSEIAAFATLKINNPNEIAGVLFGVSPAHRNKNLYSYLMCLSQNWGVINNFRQMLVSTQVTNTVVQKYWCRQGFEPYKSYYTLHKWFK